MLNVCERVFLSLLLPVFLPAPLLSSPLLSLFASSPAISQPTQTRRAALMFTVGFFSIVSLALKSTL